MPRTDSVSKVAKRYVAISRPGLIQVFRAELLPGWRRSNLNYYGTFLLACYAFGSTLCFMPRH